MKPHSNSIVPERCFVRFKESLEILTYRSREVAIHRTSQIQETKITNLAINTSYDFQLQCTNIYGSSYSNVMTKATKGRKFKLGGCCYFTRIMRVIQ